MGQPPKLAHLQLNLSLIRPSKAAIPSDQQRELGRALAELLICAAQKHVEPQESEASNEPEAHR